MGTEKLDPESITTKTRKARKDCASVSFIPHFPYFQWFTSSFESQPIDELSTLLNTIISIEPGL
jgi:hypothetical protein